MRASHIIHAQSAVSKLLSKRALITKYIHAHVLMARHNVLFRRKELKTKKSSLNAYVVFANEDAAKSALAACVS